MAEREYTRDDSGRFAETPGGGGEGGGTEDKPSPQEGEQEKPKQLRQLTARAKQNVHSMEQNIYKQSFETAGAVSEDGQPLLRKDGEADSVAFTPEEIEKIRGSVFTHNHPSGRSFSREDIMLAAHVGVSEIRAVGSDGKRFRMQSQWGKTWPAPERVRAVTNKHDDLLKRDWVQRIDSGRMTLDEANNLHHDELWRRSAPELGLIYEVEDAQGNRVERTPIEPAAPPRRRVGFTGRFGE